MDQGFRRGFTAAEKTELWDRWQTLSVAHEITRHSQVRSRLLH